MAAFLALWRLAWPLILSNLSVPLLGMVDVAVVGHLPEPQHLAAVALGTTTVSVLYFLLAFLRTGTTALAAQASGAGDVVELRTTLARGLILALALGVGVILLGPLIVTLARQVFAPAPAASAELGVYIGYRLLGAPAALGSFVILGWFLGVQDARRPLLIVVATNLLNAPLAMLLGIRLGMETGGVALATVIAEYAGLGLAVLLLRRHWRRADGLPAWAEIVQPARLRQLLLFNRDLFLRNALLQAVFVAMAALGSRLGEVTLAANAVLMTFFLLGSYGLDGFAQAVETLVGQAVGRRSPPALRAAVRAGFAAALAVALALGLVFGLFGAGIVARLTSLEPVRAEAGRYLAYAALMPIVSVWAFLYDGVFFGAARAAELRDGMLIASLAFAVLALPLLPILGNHGLWLAFLAFLGARGLILAVIYRRAGGSAGFAAG